MPTRRPILLPTGLSATQPGPAWRDTTGAISGKTQTATTYIYGEMEALNTAGAYGMALLLAIASTVLLLVLRRAERKRDRWSSGYRASAAPSGS